MADVAESMLAKQANTVRDIWHLKKKKIRAKANLGFESSRIFSHSAELEWHEML